MGRASFLCAHMNSDEYQGKFYFSAKWELDCRNTLPKN